MNKRLLILSAASLLALASCGGGGSSASESKTSASSGTSSQAQSSEEKSSVESIDSSAENPSQPVVSDSVDSQPGESDSSESQSEQSDTSEFDPMDYFVDAISGAKDNMTSFVGTWSVESEGTSWYTYYAEGYEVVYDTYIAEMYEESSVAYRFFHDYDGKNWNYFEGTASLGERSGWVAYNDVVGNDLSLASNYGDERILLDKLLENIDSVYFDNGMFWLDDQEILCDIIDIAYPNTAYVPEYTASYWYDATSVNLATITLNEMGGLSRIYLWNENIDLEENCLYIQFSDIGSTALNRVIPSSVIIPPEPNEENTLAFWEYKGLSGEYIDVYPASLEVSVDDAVEPVEGVYNLEIEDQLKVSKNVIYDAVDPEIEEARLIRHSMSVEWVSSDESVATVSVNGVITAVAAGDAEIYLKALNKDDVEIKSSVIKVHVLPLPDQDLEGAVYNFKFSGISPNVDDNKYSKIFAENQLDNSNPFSIKGNAGVSVVKGGKDHLFENVNALIVRSGDQGTLNTPDAGDGVVTFDFDDQQVSGISFYYGGFYSNYKDGASFLEYIHIETSNDGENWAEIDITDEVMSKISDDNLKLLEKSFDPANKVRIVLASNMIGTSVSMAMPSIAFIANDECQSHIDAGDHPITAIQIFNTEQSSSVRVGKTLQFLAETTPENPSNPALTWHVDDADIAEIDENGLFTAKAPGTVNVWATDNTGRISSDYFEVTVSAMPEISAVYNGTWKGEDINGTPITIVIDGNAMTATSGEYSCELTYADYDDENRSFVFESETDTIKVSYSSSDDALSVLGNFNGAAIKWGNGNPKVFDRYIPVESFTLSTNKEDNKVLGGQAIIVTASFEPSDATETELTWSSSNENVIDEIVETASGAYVYTNSVSVDTEVTLTAESENGIRRTIVITVTAPRPVTSIVVSTESGATSMETGTTLQLTATTNEDADNKAVTWSSSDTDVATVNSRGVVTAKAEGSVIITATAADGSGVTGTITLTISAPASDAVPMTIQGTYSLEGSDDYCMCEGTLVIDANGAYIQDEVYGIDLSFTIYVGHDDSANTWTFTDGDGNALALEYSSNSQYYLFVNDGEDISDGYYICFSGQNPIVKQ